MPVLQGLRGRAGVTRRLGRGWLYSQALRSEVCRKSSPLVKWWFLSNRLPSQAPCSEFFQGVLVLTMALSAVGSLRMQATNAILGNLPASISRS